MELISSNGISLAWQAEGEGHPLVLISGVGYSSWFWRRLVPELARRYRVITFDNRGMGESEKAPGPYSTAMLAADVLGLLDGLGIEGAHVLGHSLGGFIAQEVVLARPSIVTKLILASTTFGGPNVIPMGPEALRVLTERSGDPVDLFNRAMAVAAAPGFGERHPEIIRELWEYRQENPVPLAQVQAGAGHNAAARIGSIRCPTLVLFGAEDGVVPVGNAALLAGRIPGAQVRVLPGVGHIFPIEDPSSTLREIEAFLG